MTGDLAPLDLQPDEPALRVCLAAEQSLPSQEVRCLRGERHRKADAGFERVRLVRELVVREDQPRLDAQHVERFQSQRGDAERLARLEDLIP